MRSRAPWQQLAPALRLSCRHRRGGGADSVRRMHGAHRIPTLLQLVDREGRAALFVRRGAAKAHPAETGRGAVNGGPRRSSRDSGANLHHPRLRGMLVTTDSKKGGGGSGAAQPGRRHHLGDRRSAIAMFFSFPRLRTRPPPLVRGRTFASERGAELQKQVAKGLTRSAISREINSSQCGNRCQR